MISEISQINLTKKQELKRKELLKREVKQLNLTDSKSIIQLIDSFTESSIEARNLGRGSKLYFKHLKKKTTIIWSLSGSLFSAGLRQIVIDSIRKNIVDALVCTGALFEQDMLEALGHKHYICSPKQNDAELQALYIDRI